MRTPVKDWWASRTVRFNSYVAAAMTAMIPAVAVMDQADWATLGLEPKWALIAVLVIKALSAAKNVELRGKTNRPINGRAE